VDLAPGSCGTDNLPKPSPESTPGNPDHTFHRPMAKLVGETLEEDFCERRRRLSAPAAFPVPIGPKIGNQVATRSAGVCGLYIRRIRM